MNNEYDFNQKLVFIGCGAIGKSTLIAAIQGTNDLEEAYVPTIFDTIQQIMPITMDGKNYLMKVELVDTAFSEFHQDFFNLLLVDSTCIVACYSVVHKYSQTALEVWVSAVKHFQEDIPILYCGTQLDMKESNISKYTTIEEIKQLVGVKDSSNFIECSAHDYFYRHGELEGCISEVFERALGIGLKYEMKLKSKSPSKCVLL